MAVKQTLEKLHLLTPSSHGCTTNKIFNMQLATQWTTDNDCKADILRNHTFSRLLHMDVQNTIRKTQLCTQLTTENTGKADF